MGSLKPSLLALRRAAGRSLSPEAKKFLVSLYLKTAETASQPPTPAPEYLSANPPIPVPVENPDAKRLTSLHLKEHVRKTLLEIENIFADGNLEQVLPVLRDRLGLDDFGQVLFSMPMPEYPQLSRLLPSMASAAVQDAWTGQNNLQLLRATANFVRSASFNYTRLTGQPLNNAKMLDFGSGYGRVARLMYYFTNPENLFGVDPMPESIALCQEHGLNGNFVQSDYLPESLALPIDDFDFIYSFSVFTHLSERATRTAFKVLRRYIAADGILLTTIRPVEYWRHDPGIPAEKVPALEAAHRADEFSFFPHIMRPVDGDIPYGDTGITTAWIARNIPEWEVIGTDSSFDDPFQILLFMRPV